MPYLKLARLPDRTPVKLTISIMPELHKALIDYATIYEQTYHEVQAAADLVPHMITVFLTNDRGFAQARIALKGAEK